MKIERVQPTQKINEKLSKKKEEPKPRKKYESGDTFEKSPEPVSYTHLTLPTNREV